MSEGVNKRKMEQINIKRRIKGGKDDGKKEDRRKVIAGERKERRNR